MTGRPGRCAVVATVAVVLVAARCRRHVAWARRPGPGRRRRRRQPRRSGTLRRARSADDEVADWCERRRPVAAQGRTLSVAIVRASDADGAMAPDRGPVVARRRPRRSLAAALHSLPAESSTSAGLAITVLRSCARSAVRRPRHWSGSPPRSAPGRRPRGATGPQRPGAALRPGADAGSGRPARPARRHRAEGALVARHATRSRRGRRRGGAQRLGALWMRRIIGRPTMTRRGSSPGARRGGAVVAGSRRRRVRSRRCPAATAAATAVQRPLAAVGASSPSPRCRRARGRAAGPVLSPSSWRGGAAAIVRCDDGAPTAERDRRSKRRCPTPPSCWSVLARRTVAHAGGHRAGPAGARPGARASPPSGNGCIAAQASPTPWAS